MRDQADRYRQFAVTASYPHRNELDEHRAIFESAIDGDADAAVHHLHAHYQRTADIILNSESELLAGDVAAD